MRKVGVFVVLLLLLTGINVSIWRTEQVLANGEQIILQLAPVDPRSLMQGDYMALSYDVARDIQRAMPTDQTGGVVIVQADALGVSRFVALDEGQALHAPQQRLQYRRRNHGVQIATNAFFFQEGTAGRYEQAAYGLFRVNKDGQPYLTHLLDKELQPIGATRVLAQ